MNIINGTLLWANSSDSHSHEHVIVRYVQNFMFRDKTWRLSRLQHFFDRTAGIWGAENCNSEYMYIPTKYQIPNTEHRIPVAAKSNAKRDQT